MTQVAALEADTPKIHGKSPYRNLSGHVGTQCAVVVPFHGSDMRSHVPFLDGITQSRVSSSTPQPSVSVYVCEMIAKGWGQEGTLNPKPYNDRISTICKSYEDQV